MSPNAPRPRHVARALRVALAVVLAALGAASTCGNPDDCVCTPCGNAITLSVIDPVGNVLVDWVMEATLDGFPVDDGGACDPAQRAQNGDAGSCSFGFESGVYRVIVRQEGFVTRELAARQSARTGEDCCNFCVGQTTFVTAVLTPE